jgi:hypothetical protein
LRDFSITLYDPEVEWIRTRKEDFVTCFKAISQYLPGEVEEAHKIWQRSEIKEVKMG